MNYSKNGAGILILILSLFGVELSESSVVDFISAIGTVVSIGLMIYNQITRPDVDRFFLKK